MNLKNSFRILAYLEGISFILLLFIATPLKHFADEPKYVKMLGMPHGLLFVAYIFMALYLKSEYTWDKTKTKWILLASIIPFAFLLIDKKYLK
ncbi:MAG: DUF3817 domain-containing protein [Flavobacteriales bacterium]|nr:DUF3817 domain-containing protein [Flavobacteriales bacterium]